MTPQKQSECGHTDDEHTSGIMCPQHPDNATYNLLSHSSIKTFKRCRRKWWLSWYRGLKPVVESPTGALAIGQRVHQVLREWYVPEGQQRIDPLDALELLIVKDWTAIAQQYDSRGESITTELQRKFSSEAELARAMVEGYLDWLAETGGDSDFAVVASETYLEAEITDKLIPFKKPTKIIGKLDVRVKRLRDGVRRFIDHKTVATFLNARQTLTLDEQMLHYMLLEKLTTKENEERCDAAIYNMLRKVKRTAKAQPPFYQRITIHHNAHAISSYEERLYATVEDLNVAQEALDDGQPVNRWAYPNPTRDCYWDCPFFQICPMFDDGSNVEGMISQHFQSGNPLSYYTQDNAIETQNN